MRWKGNISMNIRCKVKIPEGNNKFMLNFKKEWAEIMMAADENHCVEAVVMEIPNRYGTVRFHNGLLLSIEVEYIRLLE